MLRGRRPHPRPEQTRGRAGDGQRDTLGRGLAAAHRESTGKRGRSAHERKFLGFTVRRNGAKLKGADQALDQLKERVRERTRRTRGATFAVVVAELRETLLGWKAYFGITEVLSPL
ncbi:MAG TPA: group II intron maturase-specific domain-containing protein, partial [Nitrospira sp.]|nr:group II intron maturase-specific domain-containing protein [Nitrospira sp.]